MSGAANNTPLDRGLSILNTGWAHVRHFLRGARVAGISTVSLVIGLLLFAMVPQAQDLFLEIRGNGWGPGYWVAFYLLVLLAWAVPVYVSARWILWQAVEGVSDYPESFPVKRWVARLIPPLYATLCFVAVMIGQWVALKNVPTIYRSCDTAGETALFGIIPLDLFAEWLCGERLVNMTLWLYAFAAIIIAWYLLRRFLFSIRHTIVRRIAKVIWWLLTIPVLFYVVAGVGFFYVYYTYVEAPDPLSVSHLSLLPIISACIAYLVWIGVRVRSDEHASAVGTKFLHFAGVEGDDSQAIAMAKVWGPIYFGVLAATVIIIITLFAAHPVDVTAQVYRGMVVPFFLGLLVPLLTYISHVSRLIQVPLVVGLILAMGFVSFIDINDVRTVPVVTKQLKPERDSLEDAVTRWASVNGCLNDSAFRRRELSKRRIRSRVGMLSGPRLLQRRETLADCPRPILIAAAGGASRAGFLVAGLIGKLIDETIESPVKVHVVLDGGGGTFNSAKFNGNGTNVVTSSTSHTVRTWNIGSGEGTFVSKYDKYASHKAIPSGAQVAGQNAAKKDWAAHTGNILSAVYSPDGGEVATASADETARLWRGGRVRHVFKHEIDLVGVDFSPLSDTYATKQLVTATWFGIQVWEAQYNDGEPELHDKPMLELKHDFGDEYHLTRGAVYSPDGKHIVAFYDHDTAILFDAETGAIVRKLDPYADATEDVPEYRGGAAVLSVAFGSDNRYVVTASQDNIARVFDLESGKVVAQVKAEESVEQPSGPSKVSFPQLTSADLHANGKVVATAHANGSVFLWESIGEPGVFADLVQIAQYKPHREPVKSVEFAPSGNRIATTSADGKAMVWEPTGGRLGFGKKVRPFEQQLFSISSVSGGSLGAVVAYAALADAQLNRPLPEEVVINETPPPCKFVKSMMPDFLTEEERQEAKIVVDEMLGGDVHDTEWFLSGNKLVHHEKYPPLSWRSCLELVMAGDFLSPVFISLVSTDLFGMSYFGDRAAVLERAWEARYNNMTRSKLTGEGPWGQKTKEDPAKEGGPAKVNDSTKYGQLPNEGALSQPMLEVRKTVLKADPKNWLPVLLLNGTSVTTGRRIVASDINVRLETDDPRFDKEKDYLFRDAYDLHEMLASDNLTNEERANREADDRCAPVRDIPLSTGATMSARFPVISPHGNIRNRDCKIVDRVVDGGYFENFGAITSHELATALRKIYGLDPLVILINNEPSQSNMDCFHYDHRINLPKDTPESIAFSVINSPFGAMLGTRSARGSLAAIDLCKELKDSAGSKKKEQGFAYITVDPNPDNPAAELSMSWWLSKVVQKYLDEQLDLGGNRTNWKAFSSIQSARRMPDPVPEVDKANDKDDPSLAAAVPTAAVAEPTSAATPPVETPSAVAEPVTAAPGKTDP